MRPRPTASWPARPRRSEPVGESGPAGTPGGIGTDTVVLPVRWGLTTEYRYPGLTGVEVTLRFRGRALWQHRFDPDSGERHHRLRLGPVRLQWSITCDMFDGTLATSIGLDRREKRTRTWSRSRQWMERTVRFDPSFGVIGGQTDVHPPEVHDPVYGDSQNCTGAILRVHVDEGRRELCAVGSKVKSSMFPAPYPPFVFNAVACVGAFEPDGPQRYGNPESPWFNVFLGYYQLDCARAEWDRPFGFASAAGADSAPVVEDLTRLGKSDWNYFSNWDYGVPEDALEPYCHIDPASDANVDHGLVEIAGRRWRHVDLLGVEVASSYVSGHPGARQLVDNTVVSAMLHEGFGYPDPRPGYDTSFIPTRLDATLHMAYVADDEYFHTLIFGGTAHAGADRPLLDAAVEATKVVISEHYPGFGFP